MQCRSAARRFQAALAAQPVHDKCLRGARQVLATSTYDEYVRQVLATETRRFIGHDRKRGPTLKKTTPGSNCETPYCVGKKPHRIQTPPSSFGKFGLSGKDRGQVLERHTNLRLRKIKENAWWKRGILQPRGKYEKSSRPVQKPDEI